eukprot:CFRG1995T1
MPTLSDAKNLSDIKRKVHIRALDGDGGLPNRGKIAVDEQTGTAHQRNISDPVSTLSVSNKRGRSCSSSLEVPDFTPPAQDTVTGIPIKYANKTEHKRSSSVCVGKVSADNTLLSSPKESTSFVARCLNSVGGTAFGGDTTGVVAVEEETPRLEVSTSQKYFSFKHKRDMLSRSLNDLRGAFSKRFDEDTGHESARSSIYHEESEDVDTDSEKDKHKSPDQATKFREMLSYGRGTSRRRLDSNAISVEVLADRQKKFDKEFSSVAPGQIYVNDYIAAMRKKGRYFQGKIYLSDESLCFHSILLKHPVSIKYTDIEKIVKKKTTGLPQSLKMFRKEGKPVLFASLLRRETVLRDIVELWMAQNKGKTESDLLEQDGEENDSNSPSASGCGCGNEHLPRTVLNIVLNSPVDTLFHMMCDEQGFYKDFTTGKCGYTDWVMSSWIDCVDQPSVRKREFTFTKPLKKNSFGPTEAPVEMEQYLVVDVPGEKYVMASDSYTPKLPYGDNMVIKDRWCFSRETENTSRFRITCDITFRKSVFGPVKKVIVASTLPMIEEQTNKLKENLIQAAGGLAEVGTNDTEADAESGNPPVVTWQEWGEEYFEDVSVLQVLIVFFAAVVVAQLVIVQSEVKSLKVEIVQLMKFINQMQSNSSLRDS